MPAWERFVNTKFFVAIVHNDNEQSGEAIKASGAQLAHLLHPELGIVIGGLVNGAFAIPNGQVQWLRESIQPSRQPITPPDLQKKPA